MHFVIAPPATPRLPVEGDDRLFPVRRVYCVGRNYAAHSREMGNDPDREEPFFFIKPRDCVVLDGARIPYPPMTSDLHHEIELVVAIGREGADIPLAAVPDHIFGYAVGIDLTRRDLQAEAKAQRRPWDTGKACDGGAPCSRVRTAADIGHPTGGRIWLAVNGEERQNGDLSELIWSVMELTAKLSAYFRLMPGDLIFTGTPAGVGPLAKGDKVTGGVDGVAELSVEIV